MDKHILNCFLDIIKSMHHHIIFQSIFLDLVTISHIWIPVQWPIISVYFVKSFKHLLSLLLLCAIFYLSKIHTDIDKMLCAHSLTIMAKKGNGIKSEARDKISEVLFNQMLLLYYVLKSYCILYFYIFVESRIQKMIMRNRLFESTQWIDSLNPYLWNFWTQVVC